MPCHAMPRHANTPPSYHPHPPRAACCLLQVLDSPRSCRAVLEAPGVAEPMAGLHLLMDLAAVSWPPHLDALNSGAADN